MSLNAGDNIYKFTLLSKLGGNFGEVWQAFDNTIKKEVALKILDASFEPVAKLLEEAIIGNKFNHKNLLPIHYADVADFGGKTYTLISAEFYKNGSVTNHLNSRNFLPLNKALKVLQDILFGLEYLHNSGFYHNDIKPGNILFDDQFNAVLADYGITGYSPSISPVIPKKSYIVHRAPETAVTLPQISISSDIFQVGCTAFRLLNGISNLKNEFNTLGSAKYEEKKAKGQLPNQKLYEPFIPSRLKTIINKSLSIDPNNRYSSALEMRRKLEKLNFPGYWTSDSSNNIIGIGRKYTYQFELDALAGNLYNFSPTKTNNISGITTKVNDFTLKKVCNDEMIKSKNKFMEWVVENAA